jgi:hypothetical protein
VCSVIDPVAISAQRHSLTTNPHFNELLPAGLFLILPADSKLPDCHFEVGANDGLPVGFAEVTAGLIQSPDQ